MYGGTPSQAPCALCGSERSGIFFDDFGLFRRGQHDGREFIAGVTQRCEDSAAYPKVRVPHVGALDDVWELQGQLSKIVRRHSCPLITWPIWHLRARNGPFCGSDPVRVG
jgi:hypothetical protein